MHSDVRSNTSALNFLSIYLLKITYSDCTKFKLTTQHEIKHPVDIILIWITGNLNKSYFNFKSFYFTEKKIYNQLKIQFLTRP